MSKEIKSKLKCWSIAFSGCLVVTVILPIIVFGAQLFFTRGTFSTDLSNIENWKTLTSTFSFPIGVAASMLAVTSLVGLYQRSLQLSLQLEKVEEQIEIANNQFKRSEEQFELAQEQFQLAQQKECFQMFVQHRDIIIRNIDSSLKDIFEGMSHRDRELNVHYNETTLYTLLFPENSPQHFMNTSMFSCSDKGTQKWTELLANLTQLKYKDGDSISKEEFLSLIRCIAELGILIPSKMFLRSQEEKREFTEEYVDLFFVFVYSFALAIYRILIVNELREVAEISQELKHKFKRVLVK